MAEILHCSAGGRSPSCTQRWWVSCKRFGVIYRMRQRGTASTSITSAAAATSAAAMQAAACDAVDESKLWRIHGRLYDLAPFIERHPGGAWPLTISRGRDCTALFESYHPFTDSPASMLRKFEVATPSAGLRDVTADSRHRSPPPVRARDPFYDTLKARVRDLFASRKLSYKASRPRLLYYAAVLAGTAACILPYWRGSWAATVLFALGSWLCGAMGHDGAHFAVSRTSPLGNLAAGLGMSFLTSPLFWYYQHDVGHHVHTNDVDGDPDLHHYLPMYRVHRSFSSTRFTALQRSPLWVYLCYCLTTFGLVLYIPPQVLASHHFHVTPVLTLGRTAVAVQVAHVAVYALLVAVMPLLLAVSSAASLSVSLFAGVAARLLLYVMITGFLFGWFSQVNHLNEHAIAAGAAAAAAAAEDEDSSGSSSGSESENGEDSSDAAWSGWAKRQVETSNNYALHSWLWTWLSNGLNYQIEHHLFPAINHEHLPLIAPIVQATCKEFGVHYRCFPTMTAIAKETARYYKLLAD
eukprot:PLAT896.1.p1 GENE.PLAT896.1~~PLAT896.1.p1  ORF type:complete len:523 (+),score=173.82 PLAT896.1:130-1698(+)